MYDYHLIGWACFCVSYSGKPFSGFAGEHTPVTGVKRNYQTEVHNYIMKQIRLLKDVKFVCGSYDKVIIPKNSIIYCDPPYKGVEGYRIKFDHVKFWDYIRYLVAEGYKVFISEYEAPKDFLCIWKGQLRSSLSANGLYGGSKISIEKLFVHYTQADL